MSEIQRKRGLRVQDSIRNILYHEWDPIGIAGEAPRDEYDSYIAPVYRILVGSRSKEELVEYLQKAESECIGLGPASSEALETVALSLLALGNLHDGT